MLLPRRFSVSWMSIFSLSVGSVSIPFCSLFPSIRKHFIVRPCTPQPSRWRVNCDRIASLNSLFGFPLKSRLQDRTKLPHPNFGSWGEVVSAPFLTFNLNPLSVPRASRFLSLYHHWTPGRYRIHPDPFCDSSPPVPDLIPRYFFHHFWNNSGTTFAIAGWQHLYPIVTALVTRLYLISA